MSGGNEQRPTMVRGVRGATTVASNEAEAILEATAELLTSILAANTFTLEDIASALFTVTPDLTAAFPAMAARRLGWQWVPLLNFTEIDVVGGLARCIRVLLHVNTPCSQREMAHIYLHGARSLRPDLPQIDSSHSPAPYVTKERTQS